ncbi:cobalamin biosynthesis protein CobQ [Profundibacter amoris]|uniref:Cobalamin biosynthesis protein CobQ n=2 Tax=Profundibacter amoris TaxID=2171755 RepID=A0A347UJ78_9RHOB|nr:cobalamin biosynthesis protein CobQ [Profundibacter amoris]
MLLGAAVFGRANHARITAAALLGGLAPDISLYVMAGWALFVQNIPPDVVFGQYYFSREWMQVFAYDNSFILWGALLGFGLWRRKPLVIAFAGAAILHLVTDFLLHHDDARPHFWPLSDWVFQSPVSYWDSRYYGRIIAPLELLMDFILCFILWQRHRGRWARYVVGGTTAVLFVPLVLWGVAMTDGNGHWH